MTTSDQPSAPQFCQWEIWQVVWEHEDGTSKNRPALILSSTSVAKVDTELWVAKFTKTDFPLPFKMYFDRTAPSFKETGLTANCYLYLASARRIDKSKFLYRRGRLPVLSAALVGVMLKQALKFPIP